MVRRRPERREKKESEARIDMWEQTWDQRENDRLKWESETRGIERDRFEGEREDRSARTQTGEDRSTRTTLKKTDASPKTTLERQIHGGNDR
jgi:hypothetical protein